MLKRIASLVGGIHHGIVRSAKEATVDKVDALYRHFTNQGYLPPYTLRQFVGGSKGFREVGPWFVKEFESLGLLEPGCKVLDVGCGCGRLAYAFAVDPGVQAKGVSYTGMDVDKKSIAWCNDKIASRFPDFSFYHVDMRSRTYNPGGAHEAKNYVFPHPDASFDLFILTSVFTHLVEADASQFLREMARMAKPEATIYASFFVYKDEREAVEGVPRRQNRFPFFHGDFAVADEKFPEHAIAFREEFLIGLLNENGLRLKAPVKYGLQDVFLLGKK